MPPLPLPRRRPSTAAGFTLTEALVALSLSLTLSAAFLMLFRQGGRTLRLEPELAVLRHDAGQALDRIAADLARAGSGIPPEIPVFNDLGPAGNGDVDGLDFLTAPARMAGIGFEPVVAFDGTEATLALPASRLDPESRPWAVVFNDDKFMPRWVFGQVLAVGGGGGGLLSGAVASARDALGEESAPAGATVRIRPMETGWHRRFHAGDGASFSPGQGGLVGKSLQALLGGFVESVFPAAANPAVAALTSKLVEAVVSGVRARRGRAGTGVRAASADEEEEDEEGYGMFGLGQPGLTPVSRIRYELRAPNGDGDRVLMRQVDAEPPQPVAFLEDFQVRYFTGDDAGIARDDPPGFVGDMRRASTLSAHLVRAVEVTVRVRSTAGRFAALPGEGGGDGALSRTYTRRVGIRATAAGVDRRFWEEAMQQKAVLADVPRIGPLRFLSVILDALE